MARIAHAISNSSTPTGGDVVGAYKSLPTVHYTRCVTNDGWPSFVGRLWQSNYYEHIIHNTESLNRIRAYIAANPACWAEDAENPTGEGRGDPTDHTYEGKS